MTEDQPRPGVRLLDAMPRPLLITFVMFGLVAIASVVVVLVKPPTFGSIALAERRPPPAGTFSHDAAAVIAVPAPSVIPTLPAPCSAVSGARLVGGGDAVLRLRSVLELSCRLRRGVSSDVTAAVSALDGATIRFATFGRTGVESTLDYATSTIWLNIKFARRKLTVAMIAPVVLHEAWHLVDRAKSVTAASEVDARRVELAACRALIDIRSWPRWCKDAQRLTDLSSARAEALLRSAGYR